MNAGKEKLSGCRYERHVSLQLQTAYLATDVREFPIYGSSRHDLAAEIADARDALPCRLQLPEAPCLNVGSPKRPTYLPAEVCKLARGQRRLKLNERQTAEMVKIAAKKPRERHQIIEASICEKARLPQDPVVAAWGMQIQPRIAQVSCGSLS